MFRLNAFPRLQYALDDIGRVWRAIGRPWADLAAVKTTQIDIVNAVGAQQAELADAAKTMKALQDEVARLEVRTRDQDANIRCLLGRLEDMRRELIVRPTGAGAIEPKVLRPDKLAKAKESGLRLSFGLPERDGYIAIGPRELPGIDVVADAGDLPFDRASVAEIFASHVAERYPDAQFRGEILPHWRSLLKKGGILRAIARDMEAMVNKAAAGELSFERLREELYGTHAGVGEFRHNQFTPERFAQVLQESGFSNVRIDARGRLNGACYEFEIVGLRDQ